MLFINVHKFNWLTLNPKKPELITMTETTNYITRKTEYIIKLKHRISEISLKKLEENFLYKLTLWKLRRSREPIIEVIHTNIVIKEIHVAANALEPNLLYFKIQFFFIALYSGAVNRMGSIDFYFSTVKYISEGKKLNKISKPKWPGKLHVVYKTNKEINKPRSFRHIFVFVYHFCIENCNQFYMVLNRES